MSPYEGVDLFEPIRRVRRYPRSRVFRPSSGFAGMHRRRHRQRWSPELKAAKATSN